MTGSDAYRLAEQALWRSVGAAPTERVLHLDRLGGTVRVQELGTGDPVVYIHGASNGGTSWASLAARMSDFRCILVDRPGCGLSPRLERSLTDMDDLGSFAEDLVADVLDAVDAPRAHLIGTSFGGYVVLRAASAHPERVDRLVTLSWSLGAPSISTPLYMRLAMQRPMRRLAAKIRPSERMARSLLKQIGLRDALESGRFGRVEMDWFLSLLRDTDTMANEVDTMPPITNLRGFNSYTLLTPTQLAKVASPTFMLWGENDPMGGAEIARRFAGEFPDATLEMMANAGHAPWIDDPDHVAGRVTEFLQAAR